MGTWKWISLFNHPIFRLKHSKRFWFSFWVHFTRQHKVLSPIDMAEVKYITFTLLSLENGYLLSYNSIKDFMKKIFVAIVIRTEMTHTLTSFGTIVGSSTDYNFPFFDSRSIPTHVNVPIISRNHEYKRRKWEEPNELFYILRISVKKN